MYCSWDRANYYKNVIRAYSNKFNRFVSKQRSEIYIAIWICLVLFGSFAQRIKPLYVLTCIYVNKFDSRSLSSKFTNNYDLHPFIVSKKYEVALYSYINTYWNYKYAITSIN